MRRTHLLVKGARLETERVDNVVDLLGTGLEGLLGLLGGGVGACSKCQCQFQLRAVLVRAGELARSHSPISTSPSLTRIMEQSTSRAMSSISLLRCVS